MIILAIYSTACPMIWGFCGKIVRDEKSAKYKICILALTVVGMTCSYLFPLGTLINFIYSISGYVGAAASVGMIIIDAVMQAKKMINGGKTGVREHKNEDDPYVHVDMAACGGSAENSKEAN